jgi:hypothetical protein
MASVADLETSAEEYLRRYTDPDGRRAFQAYDRVGDPSRLEAVDLLAPALLDAPLKAEHVIAMYRSSGEYRQLREAMERVLSEPCTTDARFEDQDLAAEEGPWALVRGALRASNATSHIKASKVTKILHRKRPALVPIFDSRVADFYGVHRQKPWLLWPILKQELIEHGRWLRELAREHPTPDGRDLTAVRALDIIVWEHMQPSS